jgi:hypothetical protein
MPPFKSKHHILDKKIIKDLNKKKKNPKKSMVENDKVVTHVNVILNEPWATHCGSLQLTKKAMLSIITKQTPQFQNKLFS